MAIKKSTVIDTQTAPREVIFYDGDVTFTLPLAEGVKVEAEGNVVLEQGGGDNLTIYSAEGDIVCKKRVGDDFFAVAGGEIQIEDIGKSARFNARSVKPYMPAQP
jgi:hypothetical protein